MMHVPADRPDHPDFDILSELALDQDTERSEEDNEAYVAQYVDADSLIYLVTNRSLAAATVTCGGDLSAVTFMAAMLGSGAIDGFLLGVRFAEQKAKGRKRETLDD